MMVSARAHARRLCLHVGAEQAMGTVPGMQCKSGHVGWGPPLDYPCATLSAEGAHVGSVGRPRPSLMAQC
jgi:hypothetical protein